MPPSLSRWLHYLTWDLISSPEGYSHWVRWGLSPVRWGTNVYIYTHPFTLGYKVQGILPKQLQGMTMLISDKVLNFCKRGICMYGVFLFWWKWAYMSQKSGTMSLISLAFFEFPMGLYISRNHGFHKQVFSFFWVKTNKLEERLLLALVYLVKFTRGPWKMVLGLQQRLDSKALLSSIPLLGCYLNSTITILFLWSATATRGQKWF